MKNSYSIAIARVAPVLVLFLAFCAATKAANPCDVSNLPQQIRTKLEKNYADWQPERVENLYEDDRPLWTKAHPDDCPGIAIGHFESKAELSYALLLISRPDRKRLGFRLVVFSRTGPSALYVPHLVTDWNIGLFYQGSGQAISTVPPGHYEEAIGPKKVRTDLDAISLEDFEKGIAVYYWKLGRYHELITSE